MLARGVSPLNKFCYHINVKLSGITVFQVSDFSDKCLTDRHTANIQIKITPSPMLRRVQPQILTDVSGNRSAFTVLRKTVQSSWTALTLKTKAQRSFATLPNSRHGVIS